MAEIQILGVIGGTTMPKRISAPLDEATVAGLHAGDEVLIDGTVYVARDAAHKRMVELLDSGQPLPFDPKGQIIYYMGPAPARPGRIIGSAGPTTSGRMDRYAPRLMATGIKAMIGKGSRSPSVRDAMKEYKAVYLAAIGGAGALIARSIVANEIIAWDELGAEALRRLTVREFPAIVIDDIYGNDLYEQAKMQWGQSNTAAVAPQKTS
jgi:fumarate hydratase subunit beta